MTGYTSEDWNRLANDVAESDAKPCLVDPFTLRCAQHPAMTRFVPGVGNVCLVGARKMTIEQGLVAPVSMCTPSTNSH